LLREGKIVKCTSTRFGSFDVRDESILTFPSGLFGFPEQQRYVILDHDSEAPFKWLQSVEEPTLAFVIMDPTLFHPGFHIDVPTDALGEIRAREREDLALVVILTIPSDDPGRITANLRGPLVISHTTKLGKQLVLSEDFPTRHPLFPVSGPPSAEIAQASLPVECPV
jgi:flagellar assembly factor FliW